jgi:transcriptional regulator of acetoin/glycerol metabolism
MKRKTGEIDRVMADCLRAYCTSLMQAYRWNVGKAAAHAGRDRSTFHRLLWRLGILGKRRA